MKTTIFLTSQTNSKVQSMQDYLKMLLTRGKNNLSILFRGKFIKISHICFKKLNREIILERDQKIHNKVSL